MLVWTLFFKIYSIIICVLILFLSDNVHVEEFLSSGTMSYYGIKY